MGSCNYYLKARYKSPEEASEARMKIAAFIKEAYGAHDFWQENRGKHHLAFWASFARFPLVLKYLEDTGQKTDDCNNGMAGSLSLTESADSHEDVEAHGSEVWYFAEVWHLASWTRLCQWLKEEGADAAIYISDEDRNFNTAEADPFANLKFAATLRDSIARCMIAGMVGA